MARTRQTLRAALSIDTIIDLNHDQIDNFGGGWQPTQKNLQNPGTLYHVLDEIRGSVFGVDLYPAIMDKAAILSYRKMSGHVFFDGNKRTGIATCELFLALNGYWMKIDKEETIPVAIRVADHRDMEYEEYLEWLKQQIKFSWPAYLIISIELKSLQWMNRITTPPRGEPYLI